MQPCPTLVLFGRFREMCRNVVIPVLDRLGVTSRREFTILDGPMARAGSSLPYLVSLRSQMENDMKDRVEELELTLAPLVPRTAEQSERLDTNYALSIYFAEKV